MARTSVLLALLLPGCVTSSDELDSMDRDGDGWYHAAAADLGEPGPFDCDDGDVDVHPEAVELCDGRDQDCDGAADVADTTWYRNEDGDAFGDGSKPTEACAQPSGYAAVSGDCDDASAFVFPGADEVWYDGTDQDCDEASDFDQDRDGADAVEHGGSDCDDLDEQAAPGLVVLFPGPSAPAPPSRPSIQRPTTSTPSASATSTATARTTSSSALGTRSWC